VTARAWTELDLDAVRHNAKALRRHAGRPLLAVVKADGYGHGAEAVARAALQGGAERLGVATAAEALALRQAGLAAPIQVLGSFLPDELPDLIHARAAITLHEPSDLTSVAASARRAGRPLPVHVKVDVGMARHGMPPRVALELLAQAQASPEVQVEGLMTHLPSAGASDPASTLAQIARFRAAAREARARHLLPRWVHAAASTALARFPEARCRLVRSGIGLVGADPAGFIRGAGVRLRPALAVRARVMRLKSVERGARVGYGGRWTAPRDSRLAIVGMGYADGLPYTLTGRGACVLIQGEPCPIVGSVMMDYVLVDTTGLPMAPSPGDVATFVGSDQGRRLGLEEQAQRAGLIPYALSCGLGSRLERRVVDRSATQRIRRAA
jgi:alanine racemase